MSAQFDTNQSYSLFDQPMTMPEHADAQQLGPSSVKDVGSGPERSRAGC
ncbi:hypothetical protein AB0O67_01335 [Streptomyces sp. NPDC086077]